jgi:hypothetical protein
LFVARQFNANAGQRFAALVGAYFRAIMGVDESAQLQMLNWLK